MLWKSFLLKKKNKIDLEINFKRHKRAMSTQGNKSLLREATIFFSNKIFLVHLYYTARDFFSIVKLLEIAWDMPAYINIYIIRIYNRSTDRKWMCEVISINIFFSSALSRAIINIVFPIFLWKIDVLLTNNYYMIYYVHKKTQTISHLIKLSY
jgi:hypothetical protein